MELGKLVWICLVVTLCVVKQPDQVSCNSQPRFSIPVLVIQTVEQLPVDTLVGVVDAVDSDGDPVHYKLQSNDTAHFAINPSSGIIFIAQVIDREELTSDTLTLVVQAADVVEPDKKASLTVIVHVKDINDNSPQFLNLPYAANISENTTAETTILTVTAEDHDATSELLFYIVSGNEDNTFSLDVYSGKLVLQKKLSYRNTTTYTLNITVEDSRPNDPDRHVAHAVLLIRINNEDNHGAVFTRSKYIAFVKEGALQNEYVLRVLAVDKDVGANSDVHYKIHEDNSGMFHIDEVSGVVTITGTTAASTQKTFVVILKATSSHHNASYSSLDVTVDNAEAIKPYFRLNTYEASVLKSDTFGTPILEVDVVTSLASDEDILSVILISGGSLYLEIDGNGLVTKRVGANTDIPKLQVMKVGFHSRNGQLSTANVKVYLNEDPSKPFLVDSDFEPSILENEIINFPVTTILALDGYTSDMEYSLDEDTGRFRINKKTGLVTTAAVLDREEHSSYNFTVFAINRARTNRTTACELMVTILDANDNAPVFLKKEYFLKAYRDIKVNEAIATVTATDLDLGDNRRVSYSTVENDSKGLLRVFPSNGTLYVAGSLSSVPIGTIFTISVKATDHGAPSKSNTVELSIQLSKAEDTLLIRSDRTDVEEQLREFSSDLQELVGGRVHVVSLTTKRDLPLTDLVFFSINTTTSIALERVLLTRRLNQAFQMQHSFFRKWNITLYTLPENMVSSALEEVNGNTWHLAAYIVLALSGLLLVLVAVAATRIIIMKRRNNKRPSRSRSCGYSEGATEKASTRRSVELYESKHDTEPSETSKLRRASLFASYPFYGRPPSMNGSRSSIAFDSSSAITVYRHPNDIDVDHERSHVGARHNSLAVMSPEIIDNPLSSRISVSANDLETIRIDDSKLTQSRKGITTRKTDC